MNNFVTVEFDPSTSTITCVFLNKPATTEKTCDVTYSIPCQEESDKIARSGPTYDTTVSVTLEIESSTHSLCYDVNATSGNSTVEVKGRYGR